MKCESYEVVVSEQAEVQMAAHYHWLVRQTRQHAMPWFLGIQEAILSLELWPKGHPVAEESDVFGVETRKMPHGSHVVLFQVNDASCRVDVIAVRPGAQRKFG